MTKQNDDLRQRLSGYREINISVTGRKSGRIISNPVWFVFDDDKLYLLPVKGSETSGTRTCSKTQRFGSVCAVQRLNCRAYRSRMPNRWRL